MLLEAAAMLLEASAICLRCCWQQSLQYCNSCGLFSCFPMLFRALLSLVEAVAASIARVCCATACTALYFHVGVAPKDYTTTIANHNTTNY
jgi:hypothetical protein